MSFYANVDFGPFFIAYCFYITVFVLAEFARKLVDRYVPPNKLTYTFCIEAIATAQMCTCVYENVGYFFVVTTLLLAGGAMNRGAFVSPLKPIEMFYFGSIDSDRLLSVLAGEFLGGYSAYRLARQLWYWSLNLATDHASSYATTHCKLMYKVPFSYAFTFEIFACFLIRTIVTRLPIKTTRYAVPLILSGFLTFALTFIGVPGLNPTIASSRLQGCDGLDTKWFILTYWICPTIGWMLSAIVDNRLKAGSKLTGKAASQKAE
ncbi:unnamed protein product [Anisakis simplex]|uniref:Aquaporin n=1 Tax=Anisakis simplex TaxID=6269 RepID=A0A0M3JVW7_ANISI|nr:unnamed protein product [Anisakis simplex]